MSRIVIRHTIGSKANQVEQFPLDRFDELPIGRDQTSAITFDPERDDLVSRRHAVIRVQRGDRLGFTIEDRQSANGTYVNGSKVSGEQELLPGDRIQCGVNGPAFVFDVEPRPAHLVGRTRQIVLPGPGQAPSATRIGGVAVSPVGASDGEASRTAGAREGVGRATLEREIGRLTRDRQATSRRWAYALAAVLVTSAAIGGAVHWVNQRHQVRLEAEAEAARQAAATAQQQAATAQASVDAAEKSLVERAGTVSRKQIAATYADSTVYIYAAWKLYDPITGKQVFHRCRTEKDTGRCRPYFVKLGNGNLVRLLMADDEKVSNLAIGGAGSGTGFVVGSDGFILTNKHVAAGWETSYEYDETLVDPRRALVVEPGGLLSAASDLPPALLPAFRDLRDWVPANGSPLFRIGKAPGGLERLDIADDGSELEGRSDALAVRFPGNRVDVAAKLVRTSTDADVALIKIDVPEPVRKVEMADKQYRPALGEPVTVIGYPAVSATNRAVVLSSEAGVQRTSEEIIPEPTVTDGMVQNLSMPAQFLAGDAPIAIHGSMGDAYQLSVLATGPGNSGGPVFDSAGKVIGIFTYVATRYTGERVSYAVPIKYGLDLMQLQRVHP